MAHLYRCDIIASPAPLLSLIPPSTVNLTLMFSIFPIYLSCVSPEMLLAAVVFAHVFSHRDYKEDMFSNGSSDRGPASGGIMGGRERKAPSCGQLLLREGKAKVSKSCALSALLRKHTPRASASSSSLASSTIKDSSNSLSALAVESTTPAPTNPITDAPSHSPSPLTPLLSKMMRVGGADGGVESGCGGGCGEVGDIMSSDRSVGCGRGVIEEQLMDSPTKNQARLLSSASSLAPSSTLHHLSQNRSRAATTGRIRDV